MPEIPLTVEQAALALRRGDVTSVELVEACLDRADEHDAAVGSYLVRFDDYALATAAQADADLAAGVDKGPMQGIPVGMKDIVAMAEGPTTANSLVLDPAWGAAKDAPVVRRLKGAGAVITGKVVTSEFAIGSPDATKPFPIPRNPWNLETTPGGSSAGTGNGVAAGFFLAGIGTDTGGSIRIPAAFNGTSGLMPTTGRVPKSGVVPLGYSLDHVGPLARSAWDCAAMLDVLAGYDASDCTSIDAPAPDAVAALVDLDLTGVTIGLVKAGHFNEGHDPSAMDAYDIAAAVLSEMGATVVEAQVPYYAEIGAAVMLTMLSEAFAYHRPDLQTRWSDYYVRTRAMVGLGALVSGPDFVQAQRVRRVAQRGLADLFGSVDVIATPTATIGAPLEAVFAMDDDGFAELMAHCHTFYWDGVGNPVLALPMGFTGAGLPLSLQLAGRPFEEALLLRAGHAFQQATDWHLRVPELSAVAG